MTVIGVYTTISCMAGASDEIVYNCLAVRVRLIGRSVTSLYDAAVEKHGVGIAQVNLLAALGAAGPCSPMTLSEILQLDRSTVSRNVGLLTKRGWTEAVSADAKGVREVALTPSGRRKLESVLPAWRAAQREAEELLGAAGVTAIRAIATDLGHIPDG